MGTEQRAGGGGGGGGGGGTANGAGGRGRPRSLTGRGQDDGYDDPYDRIQRMMDNVCKKVDTLHSDLDGLKGYVDEYRDINGAFIWPSRIEEDARGQKQGGKMRQRKARRHVLWIIGVCLLVTIGN